jgi:hypothetical protein
MFRSLLVISLFTSLCAFADSTEVKSLALGTIPSEAIAILGTEESAAIAPDIQVAVDTKKVQSDFLNNSTPGTKL